MRYELSGEPGKMVQPTRELLLLLQHRQFRQLQHETERGESDTSASTLRTMAAVFLVIAVVGGLVAATTAAGTSAANTVTNSTW
jgi:hypothetical protein